MKNSVFKKIVSVIAVAAITITSSVVALAENDYATQTTDCSSGTNWSYWDQPGVTNDVENGAFKNERSIFVTTDPEAYGITDAEGNPVTSGETHFTAGENGAWVKSDTNTSDVIASYNFAEKTFTKGVFQAKFDVMFGGGDGQKINVGFNGSTTSMWNCAGVEISKTGMRPWKPNGLWGSRTYYNEDHSAIADNKWYTFTVIYDIDGQTISYYAEDKEDSTWGASATVSVSDFFSGYTKGAVKGISFQGARKMDIPGTTSAVPTSVWYLDNVELDAYTETNYALSSVYRSSKGVETNKAVENFPLQGLLLSRITGVKDPASVSLVTASYDTDTRMIDAVTTPVSTIGATPVLQEVEEGDTVKTFILDMNNARPYIPVYQYTEPETTYRKLDFGDGFWIPTWPFNEASLTDEGYNYGQIATQGVALTKVNDTADNAVMKVERSVFKSNDQYITWDSTANKATTTTSAPTNGYFGLKLDKAATNLTVSFRFKFAGVDNANGIQTIGIATGETDEANPLIRIQRKANGSGTLYFYFGGSGISYTDMLADTWYDFSYTIDLTAKTLEAWLSGEFGAGYKELSGGKKDLTTITGTPALNSSISVLKIGSPAGGSPNAYDRAFTSVELDEATATEFKTKTSVFYIDDLKVEYK